MKIEDYYYCCYYCYCCCQYTTNSTTTSITINTTTFEDSATSASPSRYCEINFQKRMHIRFLNHQPVKTVVK